MTMIIIGVLIVAFAYSSVAGSGWFGRTATIYVNAQSSHVANSVILTIWVNGFQIFKGTLDPLNKKTIEYAPIFFDDAATYTVKYQTEGGGLGATGGTYNVEVVKGDVKNVNMLV
ncbi:MAG: hypothetical protein SA339_13085 [Methanomassiliicoccus sp.]|nr:hypothetical protein [Methanomassiliicoccus sp.]